MNVLQVLVCGTNYGRIYLEAIRLGGPAYKLVGVLARGSPVSQLVAHEYGIPLYRHIEDLPSGIDFACAAMGASGSDVVLGLLSRGIHVLCEHPPKSSHLLAALDLANSSDLCFHINGHFANLEAAAAFVNLCRRKRGVTPACFFHVTATDRSLYAVVDILRRVLVSFTPCELKLTSRLPPFTTIQGLLAGIPVTFDLQSGDSQRPLADGSPEYLVDHRIVVGFPFGILTLLSMNGPVIWNANLNQGAPRNEAIFTIAHEDCSLTIERLHEQRVCANLSAVLALTQNIRDRATPPEQTRDYLLDVSGLWENLGALLLDRTLTPMS
jgi:pyochelin biosynthesis protein PchG